MKRYKHTQQKKATERASFYIALSVCMMAVGLAVWSAYSTINANMDEDDTYFSSLSSGVAAVGQDMTGVTEPETQAATQPAPTTAPAAHETEGPENVRRFIISETEPPKAEEADRQAELNSLQAVLRVTDSLIYPVKSHSVIKQYSENSVYNKTMQDYRAHTGCDFAADEGESVYAMCAGTVKNISVSELYGVIIEVDCGDFSVYYCGLNPDFVVDKGDEVISGDTIGTVGQIPSESADDSHIHIEIRVGDKLIDPLSVIDNNS